MRHVAAYALLVLGGNAAPTAGDVEKVLKEAGATHDADSVKSLIDNCKGKALNELIAEGLKKVNACGGGGGAPATGGAPAAKAAEKPKEESEEEEADVDMGGLFGGDDDY